MDEEGLKKGGGGEGGRKEGRKGLERGWKLEGGGESTYLHIHVWYIYVHIYMYVRYITSIYILYTYIQKVILHMCVLYI